MEKLPNLSIENSYPGKIIAGIDEAGRGPLVGPVVAAAVILDTNNIPQGINDSKKLTAKKRELLFAEIIQNHSYGIGQANLYEIEEYNILGATKLAMIRSFNKLPIKPDIALVDGNLTPELDCESHPIIKGDSLSLSIAAASIIAKVTRDRILHELAKIHPEYGWEKNSGYGTKKHIEALHKFGVTQYHRKSFAPVKDLV